MLVQQLQHPFFWLPFWFQQNFFFANRKIEVAITFEEDVLFQLLDCRLLIGPQTPCLPGATMLFLQQWKKCRSDPTVASHTLPLQSLSVVSNNGLPQLLPGFATATMLLIGCWVFVATQTACVRSAFQVQCKDGRSRSARLSTLNPVQGKGCTRSSVPCALTSDPQLCQTLAS